MSPLAPFLAPERDPAFKLGMPYNNSTRLYTIPGNAGRFTEGTNSPSGNTDRFTFWYTPTPVIIDQLAAEVTTLDSGKLFRIGFYYCDENYQPVGAPLADSGDISTTTTGVKTYTPGTPIYVPRGRYASVMNTNSATNATFRTYGMTGGCPAGIASTLGTSAQFGRGEKTRTYAAFTSTASWDTYQNTSPSGLQHQVVYRVTAA